MDERLTKALAFSNFTLTVNNQKKTIKTRVAQLRVVHYDGGVFTADHNTISFIKTLIDLGHKKSLVEDNRGTPINASSLSDLLDLLVSAYFNSMNELDAEYEKIKKSRSINKLMDW
jgi:hypothetical protein